MLVNHLIEGAAKRPGTREPLVDNDAQGVLVAGYTGHALQLLWSGVRDGALEVFQDSIQVLGFDGDTEIAEQNFVIWAEQHVVRFDVAMDQFLIMDVLQGIGNLLDIIYNGRKWEACTFRMLLAQVAFRSIVHNQERSVILYTKIKYRHDMGMP